MIKKFSTASLILFSIIFLILSSNSTIAAENKSFEPRLNMPIPFKLGETRTGAFASTLGTGIKFERITSYNLSPFAEIELVNEHPAVGLRYYTDRQNGKFADIGIGDGEEGGGLFLRGGYVKELSSSLYLNLKGGTNIYSGDVSKLHLGMSLDFSWSNITDSIRLRSQKDNVKSPVNKEFRNRREIEKDLAIKYPTWPPQIRAEIARERLVADMTKKQIIESWGYPDKISGRIFSLRKKWNFLSEEASIRIWHYKTDNGYKNLQLVNGKLLMIYSSVEEN